MDILRSSFPSVHSLEDFLLLVFETPADLHTILLQADDLASYGQLLSSVYVCLPEEPKLCRVASLSQHSHQREIVFRVIERLLKKKGSVNNIICLGYGLVSEVSQVRLCSGNLEIRYTNSLVNRLFHRSWSTLLSRIGDEVMMFLLESTSMFLQVNNSCFVQLTGTPLYDLWPFETGKNPLLRPHNTPPSDIVSKERCARRHNKKAANKSKRIKAKNRKCNVSTTYVSSQKTGVRKKRKYEEIDDPKYAKLRADSCMFSLRSQRSETVYDQPKVGGGEETGLSMLEDESIAGITHGNQSSETVYDQQRVVDGEESGLSMLEDGSTGSQGNRKRNCADLTTGNYTSVAESERENVNRIKLSNSVIDGDYVVDVDFHYLDNSEYNSGMEDKEITKDADWSQRSRKRKHSDVVTELENDSGAAVEVDKGNIKKIKLSEDVTYDNVAIDIKLEKLDKSEIKLALEEEPGCLKTCTQSVNGENRRSGQGCTKKQNKDNSSFKFKPFLPSLCLNRKCAFYTRNVRERIPASATIQAVPGPEGVLSLCEAIFRDKSVSSDTATVSVTLPSLLEVSSVLTQPENIETMATAQQTRSDRIGHDRFVPCTAVKHVSGSPKGHVESANTEWKDNAAGSDRLAADVRSSTESSKDTVGYTAETKTSAGLSEVAGETHKASLCSPCKDKTSDGHTGSQVEPEPNGSQPGIQAMGPEEPATPGRSGEMLLPTCVCRLLLDFLHNHRQCPYKELLNRHCPVKHRLLPAASHSRRRKVGVSSLSMSSLLSDHTSPRQVYLFLRACLMRTLPWDLIGRCNNRNRLLKNMSTMLSMGKQDKMTLGQLMANMKTSEVDWLQNVLPNSCRLHLLARLVIWIFSKYIQIVLRTYFYVTGTAFLRYHMLYYRQIVWNKLHVRGISDLLKRKMLKPISKVSVQNQFRFRTSLGVSSLRFLPKQKALRPIINMGTVDVHLTNKRLSVNNHLSNVHQILRYLRGRNPGLVGHGKMGTDELYSAWRDFVCTWKASGQPALYFVKTDIANCYDSILQTKMYEILENMIQKEVGDEEFIVRKFVIVTGSKGQIQRKFRKQVSPLAEFSPDFVDFTQETISQAKLQGAILVDKVVYQHETSTSLLSTLKMHLFNNIIRVGPHYYHHIAGISQGSIISTLLCHFYYADMERSMFTSKNGELLLRVVDDCLFLTPSLKSAQEYLAGMLKGVTEYNCTVNVDKVVTNFPVTGCRGSQVKVTNEDWFPWCGTLFNTRTLETAVDYMRYSGTKIQDTMSFDLSRTPGKAMKKKLLFFLRQKCHSLYMDPVINSKTQRLRNIFYMFLLSAFRFVAFVRKLGHTHGVESNPSFYEGIVTALSGRVSSSLEKSQGKCKSHEAINSRHILWLCLKSFQLKLAHHHAQFSVLLKRVRARLSALGHKMKDQDLADVKEIVKDGLPNTFKMML